MYNHEQRKHAKKIKKKIWKYAKDDQVSVNVIYISTACFTIEDELVASEIPVFVIDGKLIYSIFNRIHIETSKQCIREFTDQDSYTYVDTEGHIYHSFEDYKKNNTLPQGPMIYPKHGYYVSNCSELEANITPACNCGERIIQVFENTKKIVGIVIKMCNVVMYCSGPQFCAFVAVAVKYGSYICMGLSALKSGFNLYKAYSRGHNTSIEWASNIAYFLSISTSFISKTMDIYYIQKAKNKMPITEVSYFAKKLYTTLKLLSIAANAVSIVMIIMNTINKSYHSVNDYFQLMISFFIFVNSLVSPKTIEELFSKESAKLVESSINSSKLDEIETEIKETSEQNTGENNESIKRDFQRIDISSFFKTNWGKIVQKASELKPGIEQIMKAYMGKNDIQFFNLSPEYIERIFNGGLTQEEWGKTKTDLESQLQKKEITQEEFDNRILELNKRIETSKQIRQLYDTVLKTFKNAESNKENNAANSEAREESISNAQNDRNHSLSKEQYVKKVLYETFKSNSLSDVQVNGRPIFTDLCTSEYAKLYKVFYDHKENCEELLKGALELAKNTNLISSSYIVKSCHILYLIQIIANYKVSLYIVL